MSDLHPYFEPIVREVLARSWKGGEIFPFTTATRRPFELQACYYARGRVQPGRSATFQGYTVAVSRHGDTVIAQCGTEQVRHSLGEWTHTITKAQPKDSWHTLGLAADFAFHSSATARDARYDVPLYRKLAGVFREVCPDVRWGNDWDQDGIEVPSDPDEHFTDLPHFEWHPGVTVREVAAGHLPPFPKQCHQCGNFRDSFRGEVCADCGRRATTAK